MGATLNEARMSTLGDKIDAQAQPKAVEKAEKPKKEKKGKKEKK